MPAPPLVGSLGRELTIGRESTQELPFWYASFRSDFETSVRKAFAVADVDAQRRAQRQEDLLMQLIAALVSKGSADPLKAPVSVSLQDLLPEEVTEHHGTKLGSAQQPPSGKVHRDNGAAPAPARGEAWHGDESCDKTQTTGMSAEKGKMSIANRTSSKSAPKTPLELFLDSSIFSGLCSFVILMNSIYMGAVADMEIKYAFNNFGSDDPGARSMLTAYFEIGFLTFYIVELLLKMLGFRMGFFNGEQWKWNMFDLALVVVGLISFVDIGYNFAWLRIFRALVKLVKALRVFRLVRFFQELRVIMLSIMHSVQTFCWAMATTMLMMYMCAIVFLQGIAEHLLNVPPQEVSDEVLLDIAEDWGSLHKAMFTEYKAIAGGAPWGHLMQALWDIGPFYYFFFLIYISILVLMVLRLLTGIFVQKAKAAADNDRDQSIEQNMIMIFQGLDQDDSGSITRAEFKMCLESEAAMEYFKMLHIKASDAMNLFSLMDSSGDGHVDTQEFISGCQRFGGWARSLDVAIALRGIHETFLVLTEFMMYVEECFDSHFGHRGIRAPPHETMKQRLDRIRNDETMRMLWEFDP